MHPVEAVPIPVIMIVAAVALALGLGHGGGLFLGGLHLEQFLAVVGLGGLQVAVPQFFLQLFDSKLEKVGHQARQHLAGDTEDAQELFFIFVGGRLAGQEAHLQRILAHDFQNTLGAQAVQHDGGDARQFQLQEQRHLHRVEVFQHLALYLVGAGQQFGRAPGVAGPGQALDHRPALLVPQVAAPEGQQGQADDGGEDRDGQKPVAAPKLGGRQRWRVAVLVIVGRGGCRLVDYFVAGLAATELPRSQAGVQRQPVGREI